MGKPEVQIGVGGLKTRSVRVAAYGRSASQVGKNTMRVSGISL